MAEAAPLAAAGGGASPELVLHLDGFEGPMHLLLELARTQKVDLARISILSLVEQYLAIIEGARRIRLELAADWLVMAAWLTWLKSRLLLPPDPASADPAEDAAELLASRLDALAHIQAGARWLAARPQLGHDVFGRGAPENMVRVDRSTLAADVGGLMRAYLAAARRRATQHGYTPRRPPMWTVADAVARLQRMLGGQAHGADWTTLDRFLPAAPADPRAALASTLVASLELARQGALDLRQDAAFAPILVRRAQDRSRHGS